MAETLPKNSLVLLDRGFHGMDTFEAFSQRNMACFMRIRAGKTGYLAVRGFLRSPARDGIITLPSSDGFRMVRCRIVRTIRQHKKGSGSTEYIFITNLTNRQQWPRKVLLKVYTARWDIETAFREMKILDHIEGLTTRSDYGVRQEIAAYMIARLLIGMTMRYAMPAVDKLLRWDNERRRIPNYVTLVDTTRDTLLAIITGYQKDASSIFCHGLVVITDAAQKRRPHRSYQRKCRGRYGRWKGTKNHRSDKGRGSQLILTNDIC
jgi:hypothetical protein